VPEGKPLNAFALEERAQDRAYALKVIQGTHEAWIKSHGVKSNMGRSGTGFGILSSPSMSELQLEATPAP